MSKPLQILIVEDSKIDADLVLDELLEGGFEPAFERVETPEGMKAALSKQSWDIIVSDYTMPRFSALEAFKVLQQSGLEIPFIIVSGSIGEELAVEALHLGIDDYVMKDNLTRFAAAVDRELGEYSQRRALKRAEAALKDVESSYRRLVDAVKDYGIFMLDLEGKIITWNAGAERITGYISDEAIGQPVSLFFAKEKAQQGKSAWGLEEALRQGRLEVEELRVRKDQSTFYANSVITPVYNEENQLIGFSQVLQDVTLRKQADEQIRQLAVELEQKVLERTKQLEFVNKELESFSYSVSHDLRAPLRNLMQISKKLLAQSTDTLSEKNKQYLRYLYEGSEKATNLINDLLNLSRVSQVKVKRKQVNLGDMAQEIAGELKALAPERQVDFKIQEGLVVLGDVALLQIAMRILLDNAWKFTQKKEQAIIEVGMTTQEGRPVYFVRDNGAGFDPQYSYKLFTAFQRLHSTDEYPGSGIGLATAQRILHRHEGHIWAESSMGQGATFYFTVK